MSAVNRRIVLASRPDGEPRESDFRLDAAPAPQPGPGRVLVRNRFISCDAGVRWRLGGDAGYAAPVPIGGVVEGATVGEVTFSDNPRFAVGDWVMAGFGWQEWGEGDGRGLMKIADDRVPRSAWIGALGVSGLTAYFGITRVGALQAGETVLVSSAAGAVGAAAGQVAKLKGAGRVVGIAGGAAKCAWLLAHGFDAAIDYKAESDLAAAVRRECPDGVDIFFDNVGGEMLDAVLTCLALRGRVLISGAVSQYNVAPDARTGLRNTPFLIAQRARMEGFLVWDFARDFKSAWAELADWLAAGQLHAHEDVVDGLDALPRAFCDLFLGQSMGRKIARL